MLTVSSRIEVYPSVYYEDDGMRTYDVTKAPIGWHKAQGTLTSDGDIGTLVIATGEDYAGWNKHMEFEVDSYGYYIGRVTSLTGTNWELTVRDKPSGDWLATGYNDSTGLKTVDLSTLATGTIDRFGIRVNGSPEEKILVDYVVISNAICRTISATAIEANQVVTEGFDSSSFRYDYADSLPLLNSHVKIWLQKNGTKKKVFTGITKLNREIYDGKTPKWHETECAGYGKCLRERVFRLSTSGKVDDVINTITTDLRNEGLITTYNVTETNKETKVRGEKGGIEIGEILEDICKPQKEVDWDFYMDFGKDLHAFKKGSRFQDINISTHALSFNYEENCEELINTIKVFGIPEDVIINDSVTESTDNWTSSYGNLYLDDIRKVGSYGIAGQGDDSGMYLEVTFSPVLDLNRGGHLYAYLRYLAGYKELPDFRGSEGPLDISVYFKTDDSNYFVSSFKKGGGFKQQRVDTPLGYRTRFGGGWLEFDYFLMEIPLTRFYAISEFAEEGNPRWDKIKVIGFEINSPLPSLNDPTSFLWIDGMSIALRYAGNYADTLSIESYGIREAPDQISHILENNESCTIAASLFVTAYKDPLVVISDLTTDRNFDAIIGNDVKFVTEDLNTTITIRKITHQLDNFNLETGLELSNRFIPSLDKMLSEFQSRMDMIGFNVEAWRDMYGVGAINRGREEQVDWYNMEQDYFPMHLWKQKQFIPLMFESIEEYDYTAGSKSSISPMPPTGLEIKSDSTASDDLTNINGKILVDNSIATAFRAKVKIKQMNGRLRIGIGATSFYGAKYVYDFMPNADYISGTIFAGWADNTNESHLETSLGVWNQDTWYLLQAYYIGSDTMIHYLIDYDEKATLSVTLPTTIDAFLVYFDDVYGANTLWVKDFQVLGD